MGRRDRSLRIVTLHIGLELVAAGQAYEDSLRHEGKVRFSVDAKRLREARFAKATPLGLLPRSDTRGAGAAEDGRDQDSAR